MCFADMKKHFVIDPLISKRQQLLLATQLCRMVLKVRLLSYHCLVLFRFVSLRFPYHNPPFPAALVFALGGTMQALLSARHSLRGAGKQSGHEMQVNCCTRVYNAQRVLRGNHEPRGWVRGGAAQPTISGAWEPCLNSLFFVSFFLHSPHRKRHPHCKRTLIRMVC